MLNDFCSFDFIQIYNNQNLFARDSVNTTRLQITHDMEQSYFFFQAEDGIRDAQESRGLGDVYKRQVTGNNYNIHCKQYKVFCYSERLKGPIFISLYIRKHSLVYLLPSVQGNSPL